MPTLYPFQRKATAHCRAHLAKGKRTVLVSPTGSGKTVMAGAIAESYRNPLALGHTVALRSQLSERLCRAMTVQQLCMSGWPKGAEWPDLIVWDECHHSASEEWSLLARFFKNVPILGLTATPQRADGRGLGIFDEMVVAAQYSELIELGLLVPARVLGPSEVSDEARPDPVDAYNRHAPGTQAFFFASSIEQAEDIARRLGKTASPWHSEMGWADRKRLLKAFSEGRLKQLTTVDALTEGIDVPEAETLVSSRSFAHVSGFLQACGRVLRAAPGKTHATIIDLTAASYLQGHGSPTEDRIYSIDGRGIERRAGRRTFPHNSYWEEKDLPEYKAELVTLFDLPSKADRLRYRARLRELASKQGHTDDVVSRAWSILFGAGSAEEESTREEEKEEARGGARQARRRKAHPEATVQV